MSAGVKKVMNEAQVDQDNKTVVKSNKTGQKWFIAGVMQGSNQAASTMKMLHDQNYRVVLSELLRKYDPTCVIFDPLNHVREYIMKRFGLDMNALPKDEDPFADDAVVRTCIDIILEEIKSTDILVAFLPVASMGTGVELQKAHECGIPIYTITPLTSNWTIRSCSTKIFTDIEAFEKFIAQNHSLNKHL